MLIFIANTPRTYAWGSTDAIPAMLGQAPTGEPQAELWLGDHPGSPASVAKATPVPHTLIELIAADPEHYGVDGGSLPFLLKVLGIGAPLSLQAHPNLEQARAGFAAEDAAGVPVDAPHRNYRDANHKPELLVALSEVTALSGFRPLRDVAVDLRALSLPELSSRVAGAGAGAGVDSEQVRRDFLTWAFGGSPEVSEALRALAARVAADSASAGSAGAGSDACAGAGPDLAGLDPERLACLRSLLAHYPDDPGVLVSLLLHHVRLAPGEAIYLEPRHIHAYVSGNAVEVMAASDNVLRAGLTSKHLDAPELLRVAHFGEIEEPRIRGVRVAPGLCAWRPGVRDFQLFRARLRSDDANDTTPNVGPTRFGGTPTDAASEIVLGAEKPLVLIVTDGRVLVSRPAELSEMANVARGQSVYVSAGEPIHLTGHGEAFIATVGTWDPAV